MIGHNEVLRKVVERVSGHEVSDGAGVKLKRTVASPQLDHVDPFLLLDEFKSDRPDDYIAGFPMHPHRGIETVTYMLAGQMAHEDSLKNSGIIGPGDVQWMTAGKGIIHSEMPRQQDGLLWGFQLWVNLPACSKMSPARYQNINSEKIPQVELHDGIKIRLIAGEVNGICGPVKGIDVDPIYLDVTVPRGSIFKYPVIRGHAAMAYVFDGKGEIAGTPVDPSSLVVFSDGDYIEACGLDLGLRFLLLAGRPINEPIARFGPFVMNTHEEIEQAFKDYSNGNFV